MKKYEEVKIEVIDIDRNIITSSPGEETIPVQENFNN